MRIRLTLLPADKKAILPINYNYFLTSLIYRFIFSSSKDYSSFLHNEGYKIAESKKGFKLFTFSMLNGKKYTVKSDAIIFENAPITWEISSPVDIFIQHLINGAFTCGQVINIGNNKSGAKFLIDRLETVKKPEFKETMRFTCLSPITISKVYEKVVVGKISDNDNDFTMGLNENRDYCGDALGDTLFDDANIVDNLVLGCHYIRPWEDGFSEAIEQNLIKKYRLVHGKEPDELSDNTDNSNKINGKPEFKIIIDKNYMNKKSGKITKKINFKETEIIGFMAPFEVRGNPKLIEIGYEAGFGEKGSIGLGCVQEIK